MSILFALVTGTTLIEQFIACIKFEKRYSPHTVLSYSNDLSQFFQFLNENFGEVAIDSMSHTFIRSWLASLKEAGMTGKSINRKISTLKSFFKYLIRQEMIRQSPMLKVTAPKIAKRLPGFIDKPGMEKLLKKTEFPDNFEGATEKLILELFYSTGIRLSELVSLKTTQVDWGNSTIKVLGKGNKERIIPIGNGLKAIIGDYIARKDRELEAPDREVLLVTGRGKKLYHKYVYRVVRKYLDDITITTIEKRSPHILRHTFATHLANNGADLMAIKELLGHSSLAATQVYTHNTIEKLKEIHRQAHPKP